MHKEYAVEPAAIGQSWETFRYLIEKFGFSEGRLISRFPSTWARLVMEAADAADVPPVARKRIEEKLRAKKDVVLLKSGRTYDPDLPTWVENAIASHAQNPFQAILTAEDQDGDYCLCQEEIDDTHQLIYVPKSADIPRTAVSLAGACALLLRASRDIDIVDPYLFRIEGPQFGYRKTVREFLRAIYDSGQRNVIARLHFGNANNCPPYPHIRQNVGRWFQGVIPDTFIIQFIGWDEVQGGEDFHDRFVLTDRGGVQIGSGLAEVGPQEHALITLLDHAHAQDIRARFDPHNGVYNQFGNTLEISSNGTIREI